MKQYLAITIERECGNSGCLFGKILSEEPDISYYSDEVIRAAPEHAAVGERYFHLHDEKSRKHLFGQMRDVVRKSCPANNITRPDNLFRFRAKTVRGMANKGSCIFVGWSTDFVLDTTKFEGFVSLFVYCGMVNKTRRVMEMNGVDANEAMARVQEINHQRREYCCYFTGNNWGDPMLYDLPLDTTHLTIPETIEPVKTYFKLRGLLKA